MKKRTLSNETLADLARSGLSRKDAEKLGIESFTPEEMWGEFRIYADGYAIPYNTSFRRAKILGAYKSKYGQKPRKYTQQAGTLPQLYCPKNLKTGIWEEIFTNAAIPLVITEGEKKAAAAVKAGINCVALGGVWNFKSQGKILSQFDQIDFRGRSVEIVYDSDIISKPEVQYAEQSLALELERLGALVHRVKLPHSGQEKMGLDDFLVKHDLTKNPDLAKRSFQELPREKIEFILGQDRYSDMNNAAYFARSHGETLRFLQQGDSWISYDPTTGIWTLAKEEAMKRAKITVKTMMAEASLIKNEIIRKNTEKKVSTCGSAPRLKAMIELAATENGMTINADELDANPMILALGNGYVLELQTGRVRSSRIDDYCTKRIGTEYNSQAKCPRWNKFLCEITQNDLEMIAFIKRSVGYCLTGLTIEHFFFVLHGTGANGKSTFLSVILALLGDYAKQCSADTFMTKKNNGIGNDIARLHQIRFIATSEVEEGQYMAESLIKQFTGGDVIVARFMYKEFFEFSPVGKIFLATNHKPRLRGTDHAIWRRMRLIPFLIQVPLAKRDGTLLEKLKAELPGILNWALEGCMEWQRIGLNAPLSVIEATAEYQIEMDTLGQWMQECCDQSPSLRERVTELYSSYKQWAEDTGRKHILDRNEFVRRLAERGYPKKDSTDRSSGIKGVFLYGLSITKAEASHPAKYKKND